MAGYDTVRQVMELQETLHKMGMQWGYHHNYGGVSAFGDQVAVFPRDNELPIYSRDATLFVGTLDDLRQWIRGFEFARDYDKMLRVSSDKSRTRKEQDVRNEQTMTRLKSEKVCTKG